LHFPPVWPSSRPRWVLQPGPLEGAGNDRRH
jgi:hypothetical protein